MQDNNQTEINVKASEEPEKDLSDALKEATERANQLEREKETILLKQSAANAIIERGLPVGFMDYIMCESEEGIREKADNLKAAWSEALSFAVKSKLSPRSHPSGASSDPFLMGFEKF